ncbi:hypothetical protein PV08_08079 [Exophiala spinifera]|uniref:Uncharacterized protein n=1 Tax=Exophiala spinifera TaxID=91928 RepID=A0A0D1ZJ66_9EURO|nr:uncharacterized protein PV08_08079 [Exophiala spinifera]KIW12892.1 hypothetical protein PV08_08079 [Exophiala spinifera]
MLTPAQLAVDQLESRLAYETASNDEFYECNSDREALGDEEPVDEAPEAFDDAAYKVKLMNSLRNNFMKDVANKRNKREIIPLKKPGKDDYTLDKAWRPTFLLATLGKILESVIADRISYVVETHGLLPTQLLRGAETATPSGGLFFAAIGTRSQQNLYCRGLSATAQTLGSLPPLRSC